MRKSNQNVIIIMMTILVTLSIILFNLLIVNNKIKREYVTKKETTIKRVSKRYMHPENPDFLIESYRSNQETLDRELLESMEFDDEFWKGSWLKEILYKLNEKEYEKLTGRNNLLFLEIMRKGNVQDYINSCFANQNPPAFQGTLIATNLELKKQFNQKEISNIFFQLRRTQDGPWKMKASKLLEIIQEEIINPSNAEDKK